MASALGVIASSCCHSLGVFMVPSQQCWTRPGPLNSFLGKSDLCASPRPPCSPVLTTATPTWLLQVSGVHASQPVTTQHYDPLWGHGLETPVLYVSWHTALGDGEATVRLTLPAHEWKPGTGL